MVSADRLWRVLAQVMCSVGLFFLRNASGGGGECVDVGKEFYLRAVS